MLRKLLLAILVIVVAVAVAGLAWFASAPVTIAAADLPDHTADPARGEYLLYAGGCISCHATGGEEPAADTPVALGGGLALATPFGTFHAPNISPDPEAGIGGWSDVDFVNAMKFGVAPDGSHYYPAFPYASYQRMTYEDLLDLKAHLDTLPPVAEIAPPHELPFPYSIRRGVGLWKRLYLDGETFAPDPDATAQINRGAYLVEGPAHCGECHTPRDAFGGKIEAAALTGGPSPEGQGTIPDISPAGLDDWTAEDIAYALESGFTPDFDSFGGAMARVQRNTARLTPEDRAAIAAYLKALPAPDDEDADG